MSAFTDAEMQDLCSRAEITSQNMKVHFTTIMSARDAIALCTPPELRDLMFQASDHCERGTYMPNEVRLDIGLNVAKLYFRRRDKLPFLPLRPAFYEDGISAELLNTLKNNLEQQDRLKNSWRYVRTAIVGLNEHCRSVHEARYYLPSLTVLATPDSHLSAKLAKTRTPKAPQPLPMDLREACRKAALAIAESQLLGPPRDHPENTEVTVSLI